MPTRHLALSRAATAGLVNTIHHCTLDLIGRIVTLGKETNRSVNGLQHRGLWRSGTCRRLAAIWPRRQSTEAISGDLDAAALHGIAADKLR